MDYISRNTPPPKSLMFRALYCLRLSISSNFMRLVWHVRILILQIFCANVHKILQISYFLLEKLAFDYVQGSKFKVQLDGFRLSVLGFRFNNQQPITNNQQPITSFWFLVSGLTAPPSSYPTRHPELDSGSPDGDEACPLGDPVPRLLA